jgi:hypothetical protein
MLFVRQVNVCLELPRLACTLENPGLKLRSELPGKGCVCGLLLCTACEA